MEHWLSVYNVYVECLNEKYLDDRHTQNWPLVLRSMKAVMNLSDDLFKKHFVKDNDIPVNQYKAYKDQIISAYIGESYSQLETAFNVKIEDGVFMDEHLSGLNKHCIIVNEDIIMKQKPFVNSDAWSTYMKNKVVQQLAYVGINPKQKPKFTTIDISKQEPGPVPNAILDHTQWNEEIYDTLYVEETKTNNRINLIRLLVEIGVIPECDLNLKIANVIDDRINAMCQPLCSTIRTPEWFLHGLMLVEFINFKPTNEQIKKFYTMMRKHYIIPFTNNVSEMMETLNSMRLKMNPRNFNIEFDENIPPVIIDINYEPMTNITVTDSFKKYGPEGLFAVMNGC